MGDSKAGQDLFSWLDPWDSRWSPFLVQPITRLVLFKLCFQTSSGVSELRQQGAHVFWTFRLYKDCGGAELEPVLAEATGAWSELILH